jgi:hypothetical protein
MVTSGLYTTLTYPVHRVKVLLQTQDANPRIISGEIHRVLSIIIIISIIISCCCSSIGSSSSSSSIARSWVCWSSAGGTGQPGCLPQHFLCKSMTTPCAAAQPAPEQ